MPGVAEHGVRTDHGVRMTRHEFPLPSLLSPADYATGCLDHPAFTLSRREGTRSRTASRYSRTTNHE